jgi:hypothetical protein
VSPPSAPLRAGLIIDHGRVSAWQFRALRTAIARGQIEIAAVINCTNTSAPKQIFKHFAYFAMRTLLMRAPAMAGQPIQPLTAPGHVWIDFASRYDGLWQSIPEEVLAQAKELNLDLALKFGMGLLRGSAKFPAREGILSFHHGDPLHYRGRPVGFYELRDDADYVGAVVQRLTDTLDGGEFLAYGRFRLLRDNYRATLESVFTGSEALLPKALAQLGKGPVLNGKLGRNYRLPSNATVAKFLAKLVKRKLARLIYGVFYRKAWRQVRATAPVASLTSGDLTLSGVDTPPTAGAAFVADGFFLDPQAQTIVCEVMPAQSAFGAIMAVKPDGASHPILAERGRHFSYPFVVRENGRTFLVPEVAGWSAPFLVEIDPTTLKEVARVALLGLEDHRLLDPTILRHDGRYWLFATQAIGHRGGDALHVWSAPDLHGPYVGHRQNPIVLDPARARPGGGVLVQDGALFRLGQDNSRGYGAALTVSRIDTLTLEDYAETPVGRITLKGLSGPHTLDMAGDTVLVDGYCDILDPLAWLGRLRARFG